MQNEQLGRFDHHPDPAIDFEIEVQGLEARLFDAKGGISKPGTEPETIADVLGDIERAMTFRVGGDPVTVSAKQILRRLEDEARDASIMRTKPDDIPQDVWDAAYKAVYRGDWTVVEQVARAIVAARTDEREACACHLERIARSTPMGHENVTRGAATYNWLMHCADLIRKRGGA